MMSFSILIVPDLGTIVLISIEKFVFSLNYRFLFLSSGIDLVTLGAKTLAKELFRDLVIITY